MMFCYWMDEVYVVVKRMLICRKHRYCHAREISDPSDNKVLYYIYQKAKLHTNAHFKVSRSHSHTAC